MKSIAAKGALIKWGWLRALIYFVLVLLMAILAQHIAPDVIGLLGLDPNNTGLLGLIISYITMSVPVLAITYLMRQFIDRNSFKSLGFAWKEYSNEAGIGLFTGIAILGIASLLLIALGYVSMNVGAFAVEDFLLETVFLVFVAFVEELMFRGYLLNNLLQSTNKWIALVISAIVFAIFHISNPDISVLPVINIFVAGLLLGLNYIYTKNLWFGILLHFAWNYFQGPVFGYEVSGFKMSTVIQQTVSGPDLWTGGEFGFEGSLLCTVLQIITILFFYLMFKKRYEGQ